MLKNIWYGLAFLIFISTFVWFSKKKITGMENILGMNFFVFIGYTVLIGFIIVAIILIIRWAMKRQSESLIQ